jgi:peptide deformylase
MAKVLKVLIYPDSILREKAHSVSEFGKELSQFVEDMCETMYLYKGIGLAANQVGELKRIFILDTEWRERTEDTKKVDKNPVAYINPEIISAEGSIEYEEGCLSIPQVYGLVERSETIAVRYQDETGRSFEKELSGLSAIAFQHELDHLNGVMFIDHLSAFKRRTLLEKFHKMQLEKDRDSKGE